MKVKDVIRILQEKFDPEMEITTTRYSDLRDVVENDFYIIKGIRKPEWIQSIGDNMFERLTDEEKKEVKEFAHIEGN